MHHDYARGEVRQRPTLKMSEIPSDSFQIPWVVSPTICPMPVQRSMSVRSGVCFKNTIHDERSWYVRRTAVRIGVVCAAI